MNLGLTLIEKAGVQVDRISDKHRPADGVQRVFRGGSARLRRPERNGRRSRVSVILFDKHNVHMSQYFACGSRFSTVSAS